MSLFNLRTTIENVGDLCNALEGLTQEQKEQAYTFLSEYLGNIKIISATETTAILNCLADLGLIIAP